MSVEMLTDWEVYVRQLLPNKHGYPLWIPEPYDNLPAAYKAHGIIPGDVGILTSDGAFDYMFNILSPKEAEENVRGVPPNFEQLSPQEVTTSPDAHPANSAVASASVVPKEREPREEAVVLMDFTSSSNAGAVLALPNGAVRTDAKHLEAFQDYALKHGRDWYKYANYIQHRCISNGAIYLVTGCDKATTWANTSFTAGEPASGREEVSLKLLAGPSPRGGMAHRWHLSPWPGSFRCVREGADCPQNQAVFIRGYKVTVQTDTPGPPFSSTSPEVYATAEDLFETSSFIPFADNEPLNSPDDADEQYQVEVTRIPDYHMSEQYHPSRIINEHLLDLFPEAQVAVTHDNDWRDIIGENPTLPDNAELLRRIREKFTPVMKQGGGACLAYKPAFNYS